jgi:hypothetical protein
MKNFLTPLQYNEIFSASTDIVINGNINEEKSYLLDKCKAFKAKNVELEEILANEETLRDHMNFIGYNKLKELDKKLEIAVEALEFYANEHNYSGGYYDTISNDCEDRAKQALAAIKET